MASVELQGLNELYDLINERAKSIDNLEAFFKRLSLKFVQQSQLTFRTSIDPFGRKWDDLKSRAGQPLKKSGRLSNSIASESDENGLRIFVEGGLEYAAAHNNGSNELVNIKRHNRTIKQAFGKPINPITITIKSHMREQNLPQRMFIPNEGKLPPKWFNITEDMIAKDWSE